LITDRAPIFNRDEFFEKMRGVMNKGMKVEAMYNSLIGGVVVDLELMTIPLHDHAIARGHCCYDTCSVKNGRLYRVDIHLDRHLQSLATARIPLPFPGDTAENKRQMREAIAQTVVAGKVRTGSVRYFTSAGPGNYSVTPEDCTPAFYCTVTAGGCGMGELSDVCKGIEEYTVNVPMKPSMLASTKSNNYMLNVLCTLQAKDKGGTLGIWVDPSGNIAEAAVMNVVVMTEDDCLVTPPFEGILCGTTARKVLQLGAVLKEQGKIKDVKQQVLPLTTARKAKELFLLGGDTHFLPVTKLDGANIGDGAVGPISKLIIKMLLDDEENGQGEDHYELAYD
jgi:branched-subunit amino acid aminotransferase/4-amino-4-deoxychorismate lyase